MIKFGRLLKSFKYSFKGLVVAFKEEQNFRIHLFLTILVIILMFLLKISIIESLILIICIALVIIAELVNSIFERIVDIMKPRLHDSAKKIKDMMAATVLVASIAALIVGLIIFIPKIFDLF